MVGAILRLLNQGAELASGNADTATALRLVVNCAIPYLVSSIGCLGAPTRDAPAPPHTIDSRAGHSTGERRGVRGYGEGMMNERADHGLPSADHPVSPDGPRRPALLIFDVNETLSDMSPIGQRFEDVGAPVHLAKTWFAGLLRDGFALTAVGVNESFAAIAAEALRVVLDGQPLDRSVEDGVQHVMEGFAGLPVHADVPEGIGALRDLGIRLVTLSNGSASVAEALFDRAGIRTHFETLLSVEDAGLWKPAADAYAYALQRCEVDPMDAMLVAVHPWDIDGAARAGLATAWINRTGGPYPGYFRAPDLQAGSLTELADVLDG